jgi:RsiW-degrading membrane proteinase PrsW (M82 family)
MVFLEISLAPVIAIIIYFYWKDKYEKEPVKLLTKAFFAGVLITIPVIIVEFLISSATRNISSFFFAIFIKSFLVAGFTEEFAKFVVFKSVIYKNKEFNEPYDAIIYMVMVSLGFAAFENLAYVFGSYVRGGMFGSFATGIMRAIFSVPAHAFFAVIMGYFLGLARFAPDKKLEIRYAYTGLFFAIMMHGFYDFFVFTKAPVGLLFMVLTLMACGFIALRAIKIHLKNSPFNTDNK